MLRDEKTGKYGNFVKTEDIFLLHPLFAATCFCRSKPESIIIIIMITRWRFNGETAASHYTTSGLVVVVETCAALLHHTNVFAALKAFTYTSDIWTFPVTEVILGCFPHPSCKNSGQSILLMFAMLHKGNLAVLIRKFNCELLHQVYWSFDIPHSILCSPKHVPKFCWVLMSSQRQRFG